MEYETKKEQTNQFLNIRNVLNDDVLTGIFNFIPYKYKRYLNKELYIMGWKEMIHGRRRWQYNPQIYYNYYKFIIENSFKNDCVFILDLLVKKQDLHITWIKRKHSLMNGYVTRHGNVNYDNQEKIIDFYDRYKVYNCDKIDTKEDKIRMFSNLIYNNKMEFNYLFKTKIWPEMLNKFGSALFGREEHEKNTEYHRWNKFKNKLDYFNSKCWLR
tara:strand:+ start:582 stop:1223 length:642 start_codon:yes stop_codon:yes gene_type:complete